MNDTTKTTEYRKLVKKFVDKFSNAEVSYEVLADWYMNTTKEAFSDKKKLIFMSLLQKYYHVERSYVIKEKKLISILKIKKP